ncbi:MAG: hypothetical protein ABR520_12660 [Mycobacteriales bacterium]
MIALYIGFTLACLIVIFLGLVARAAVLAFPHRAAESLGTRTRLWAFLALLPLGISGAFWWVTREDDGMVAQLVIGALTSLAVLRLMRAGRRRWAELRAVATAPRPELPPIRGRLELPASRTRFERRAPAVRPLEPHERHDAELWDRRLRKARNALVFAGFAMFVAARLWLTVIGRPLVPLGLGMLASLALVAPVAAVRVLLRRRWRARARKVLRGLTVEALAAAHGWHTYVPGHPGAASRLPGAPLLPPDTPRRDVPITIVGRVGPWELWGLQETGPPAGPRGKEFIQYAYIVWVPGTWLPTLTLRGRDDVQTAELLMGDLPLEWEDFNRLYFIESHGMSEYAHMMIHPRLMEHIFRTLPDGARLTFCNDAVVLSGPGALEVARLEDHVECVVGVADLLPRHLVSRFRPS